MDTHFPVGSGELTPSLARTARNPHGWELVRGVATKMNVIRRFRNKYSTKKIQFSLQYERSNVSESASTKNQPAAGCAPTSSEAPFSPLCPLAQDGFNQAMPRRPTSEPQYSKGSSLEACKIFKDPSALTQSQILVALLSLQCLDESTAGLIVFSVLLIDFTHLMEGTTATDLVRLILQLASKNKLLVLGSIIVFKISGARAQTPIETCKVEPDGWEMDYYVKVAAFTLLIIWLTFVVTRNMIDRQHPEPAGVPANAFIMEALQRTDYRRSNPTLAIPERL